MDTPAAVQTEIQGDGFVEHDADELSSEEYRLRGWKARETDPCSGSCYSEFEEGRACSRHGRPAPSLGADDSEIVPESCDEDDDSFPDSLTGGVDTDVESYYTSERMDDARRIDGGIR